MYPETLSIEQDHPSLSLERQTVERLVHHVVDEENGELIHLSVVLTDHSTVHELNRTYLDHDYNTDVLSFSLRGEQNGDDDAQVEGEVYVDLDTAKERHEEFGTTFEGEAYRYIVHGLLHLLGYTDATESEQETMRSKEDQYLEAVLPSSTSP